ncbi:unnamed protein product [Boreogadus saida]
MAELGKGVEGSPSLQRKKPPWLQLDIPTIQLTPDDTPTVPQQPAGRTPLAVPRSVSMPVENQTGLSAWEPAPNHYLSPPQERRPSISQTIKSGKRVRFERGNTVPPKGQRGPRRVPTIRRRSCIPKILSRRRSSIPKQIIRPGIRLAFWTSPDGGTADWFGVSQDSDSTQRWRRRSLQHCSQLYGGLKPQVMRDMELPSQDNLSLASTETPPPLYLPHHHHHHHHHHQHHQHHHQQHLHHHHLHPNHQHCGMPRVG